MLVKVSIGICVKNSERTIKEVINSVINQDYPNELMETIVVDGESRDKTLQIVTDTFWKKNIQKKILFDRGRGLGFARQMVVDNSNSKYIIFVDGDVVIQEDFVKKQVEFMEKNPKIGVAYGKYMYLEGNLVASLCSLSQNITFNVLKGNDATIYRFQALKQTGGFDKNIKGAGEDLDVIDRIEKKNWRFSINEEAKFYHHCRETWKEVWIERIWMGYGDHYRSHKHKKTNIVLWRKIPLLFFIGGLKIASKAYKILHQKKSFLIPLFLSICGIAWWFGFIKGHIDDYGHKQLE